MMLALWTAGVGEGVAGDAYGGGAGDDFQAFYDICDDFVLEAGVEVLGVFTEDDHVDVDIGEACLESRQHLDGAYVGEQVELFAQGDVDAFEAAGDGGGDGAFEAGACFVEGVEDHGGQFDAEGGDDVAGQLRAVPDDFDACGFDDTDSGVGDFGSDAVAGDECDVVGHASILAQPRYPCTSPLAVIQRTHGKN
jgi:hypothetical protein